jgi:hypothetical protein
MPFKENTLRDTSILDTWLNDVEGIILQIVVKDAFSNSEVFIWILNNRLLKVYIELEYLSVVLKPLWCNGWNTIVNLLLTCRDSSKTIRVSVSHGSQELRINIFL